MRNSIRLAMRFASHAHSQLFIAVAVGALSLVPALAHASPFESDDPFFEATVPCLLGEPAPICLQPAPASVDSADTAPHASAFHSDDPFFDLPAVRARPAPVSVDVTDPESRSSVFPSDDPFFAATARAHLESPASATDSNAPDSPVASTDPAR